MIALYPGSFDPPTLGHLDIIRRAAALVDRLYICVAVNVDKRYLLPSGARAELLRLCTAELKNVEVLEDSGMMMDAARRLGVNALIRGLRNTLDYQKERPVADAFRAIGDLETVFIQSDPALTFISSSMVREMFAFGENSSDMVKKMVPPAVFSLLYGKNADK